MKRLPWRDGILGLAAVAGVLLAADSAMAQEPSGGPVMTITTMDQLIRLAPAELDALYQQAGPAPALSGKVRGRSLMYPGTALAVPSSKVGRLVWQGKVFDPCNGTVVNKFFGVRAIKGNVSYGESWMDGRPSLIIDYAETSHLYANFRDEIRQVAPGLYLGLMYARTCPQPTFKMYFALEGCP